MAPHWKCGSGQPVAGSNPALSATRVGLTPCCVGAVLAHAPRCARSDARRRLTIIAARAVVPTFCGFAESTSRMRVRPASSSPMLVRHRGGRPAVRHRLRVRQRRARRALLPRQGPPRRRRPGRGRDRVDEIDAVANCHLHADHAGQNASSPASRSTSSRPSGRSPTRPTTRSSTGSTSPVALPAARRRPRAVSTASGSSRRRATRPATSRSSSRPPRGRRRPRRPGLLHARRMGRRPDALEGRSQRPGSVEAYDRSIERLRGLDPVDVVRFGHDREVWTRADAGRTRRRPTARPGILRGPC